LSNMKIKPQLGNCYLEIPTSNDFMDLDIVEQVVEEALIKPPQRKKKKI
jgi:hypothetical protein